MKQLFKKLQCNNVRLALSMNVKQVTLKYIEQVIYMVAKDYP